MIGNIAFFIAQILIKIGDFVILLFKSIKSVVKNLFKPIVNLFKITFEIFDLRRLRFSRSNNKTKKQFYEKIKNRIKKSKKTKPIVIFPLPFLTKFKYFIWGIIFSCVFIFIPILIFIFIDNLPNPRMLSLRDISQTTKIYDRNHTLLYQIYANQNRTMVPLSDIPIKLQQATIAIEDKDFYDHPGFDVNAIIRSAIKNASGDGLQGGSTITQQLIKSALLSPETTIERKIKEIILAFWSERIYTKNQILEMYFNQVPYGGTAWGAEAASEIYFGKNVKDLDLAESAFLAGIPKAPTIYSPFGTTPNLWKRRQIEVLDKMLSLDYISKEDHDNAKNEELAFQTPQTPIFAPHFVMYVKDFLVKKYGLGMVEKGGLNIITSIDLKLQEDAEKIVADEVQNNTYLNLTNGASVVTDPKNGDILAMVGSKDYFDTKNDGNVNVTLSLRQPGSSIKVVTYSAALSRGLTPATILNDSPITFVATGSATVYSPVNYDGKFHGNIPLRIAFANSFNIPAVKIVNQVGVQAIVNLGKKMGIKSWDDSKKYGLSITLGGADVTMLDMATVYGTIANQGRRVDLNPILKITDYKGNILEEKKEIHGKTVLDEGITFIISSILSDNQARALEFGTNSPLNISGKTVSVKTGTSDNKRDNWTIGYTPSYVVAVWVGNNDNSPMSQSLASGITGAAPIWNKIMTEVLKNKPDEKYKMPFDVIQKPCLGRIEYFIKGTENSVNCIFTPSPSPSVSPTL
ncbi:MAG: PBP1A family penicillin-binding protein [Patescibacteria group bacterium]|nr:PBP1A family penicillin-binding protein [Patescibacteria group bacterium]